MERLFAALLDSSLNAQHSIHCLSFSLLAGLLSGMDNNGMPRPALSGRTNNNNNGMDVCGNNAIVDVRQRCAK